MAPKKRKVEVSMSAKLPKQSQSPGDFERELKDLAKKAKDEQSTSIFSGQAAVYLKVAILLALTAVSANASELSLSPVYGSIPSSAWHAYVIMGAAFTGWSTNLYLRRYLSFDPLHLLPVLAFYVPMAQYYLFQLSSLLSARWGPLITELLTLFPLMTISVACTATYLEQASFDYLPGWLGDSVPGLGSWSFLKLLERISASYLARNVGKTLLHTRVALEVLLGACYALFAPSKLLYHAIPALLHTAVFNTHLANPMALRAPNQALSKEGFTLLDRRESITGYISVLESQTLGYRVMRCDHSLLGGEWVNFPRDPVAEPIYGVFVLLEAVRLVQTPEPIVDEDASALVIGMGIGTAPGAFIAHGIDTTVVEIDPAVHEFATKYFALSPDHTPVIADAISYTSSLANDTEGQRFDYIVHDVFTGGVEPIPLFTWEFLQNLEALLKPNGVIAINYAGDLTLTPIKAVIYTIRQVFPTCRVFRENKRDAIKIEAEGRDFTNVVVFCTKSSEKLTLRRPKTADFLNSRSRQLFMMPEHEVLDSDFTSEETPRIVRNNDTEQVSRWHEQSALGHWQVMRTVMPPAVWENW